MCRSAARGAPLGVLAERRRSEMALYVTNTVRVKPGHDQQFVAYAAKVIPIYEKYGVKFLGTFGAVGGAANRVVFLVSVRDWAAYGELLQKFKGDTEVQQCDDCG